MITHAPPSDHRIGRQVTTPPPDASDDRAPWEVLLHTLLGVPLTTSNEIRVLRNGDEIFPAMLDAIDAAEHTIDIVTFIYWAGDIGQRFADHLSAAARRGCRVRVLLDAVGARKMNDGLLDEMRAAGCDVRMFRQVFDGAVPDIGEVNHRTHRKILVCDGSIGFVGGVGIADEWAGDARNEHEWRDTHLAVRGPAVAGLAAAFIDNWADESEQGFDARFERVVDVETQPGSSTCVVIRGSSSTGATDINRLLLCLIQLARRRLRITTAYFNPDERLVSELCAAVERGVEVQILVPGEHADKRFVQMNAEGMYQRVLDAGVDLRTYERTMLHAKVITVDGGVASVGSANFNQRSMELDDECNLVMADPDVVAVLDRHFDQDLEHSVVLDPDRWADRTLAQRAAERVAGAFDRWL
jgi:cardiolipin synthase